jgi:hypothetical protein
MFYVSGIIQVRVYADSHEEAYSKACVLEQNLMNRYATLNISLEEDTAQDVDTGERLQDIKDRESE